MNTMSVRDLMVSLREGAYSSVGCYPKFWATANNSVLCHACCRAEVWQVARAMRDGDNSDWRVTACQANWEDPDMNCDHCGERIESAYAEDDVPVARIRVTFELYTPESVEFGDAEERGWENEDGGVYSLNEAVQLLQGMEPSSTKFHPGVWYTSYGEACPRTGIHTNHSYHVDAPVEFQARLYAAVTRK